MTSIVVIVYDNNTVQWLRQEACGLWAIALLKQMEETLHHARHCR